MLSSFWQLQILVCAFFVAAAHAQYRDHAYLPPPVALPATDEKSEKPPDIWSKGPYDKPQSTLEELKARGGLGVNAKAFFDGKGNEFGIQKTYGYGLGYGGLQGLAGFGYAGYAGGFGGYSGGFAGGNYGSYGSFKQVHNMEAPFGQGGYIGGYGGHTGKG